MEEFDPVVEEVNKADEVASVSPLVMKLDKCRILSDTDVPPEDFLMRLFGKPCFPRRDLSAITGSEKCGKTYFTTTLMACCAEKRVLELERISDEPLRVMWYDTEQSRQSTKGILTDRIFKLCHVENTETTSCTEIDEKFFVFNVRACTCQERMDYLVAGIEAYRPDMVIIDNVSDLLPSINDPEGSAQVIDQLMQLSTRFNCNITIVIHLNRSGEKRNLRGWLGTEILHKAFDVYYCEHIENADVFSVGQTLTRKYRIMEKLYYVIDDDGLPKITTKPAGYQPRDDEGRYKTNTPDAYQIKSQNSESFNQDYIIRNDGNARQSWEWNLRKLFADAMGVQPSLSLEMLQSEVMKISGIKQPKYYEKVFKLAVDQRIVQTTLDKRSRVVAILTPS